jgi:hypothetical protein
MYVLYTYVYACRYTVGNILLQYTISNSPLFFYGYAYMYTLCMYNSNNTLIVCTFL